MSFIGLSESLETSKEILEAIDWLALGNDSEAKRIWNDPTAEEMIAIWERVTKNGLIEPEEFLWGESGKNWAI